MKFDHLTDAELITKARAAQIHNVTIDRLWNKLGTGFRAVYADDFIRDRTHLTSLLAELSNRLERR